MKVHKIFSMQILLISIVKFTRIDKLLLIIFLIIFSSKLRAQQEKINWITFEQLEDSLNLKPKKVFLFFHADWCAYCKKMKATSFKDKTIISNLNKNFYAIKMNAETKDTITFDGKKYINNQLGKSRNPTHQIALLLASRHNKDFSLPATIILNDKFKIEDRFFEYLSPKKLKKILNRKDVD